jgi:hypothetical protein
MQYSRIWPRLAGPVVAAAIALLAGACGSSGSSTPASAGSQADVAGITQAEQAWSASGMPGAKAIARDLGRIADGISNSDPALMDDAVGTLSLDVSAADRNSVPAAVHTALTDTSNADLDLGRQGGLAGAGHWLQLAVQALSSPGAHASPTPSVSLSAALDKRLIAWDKASLGYANSPEEPGLYDDNGLWLSWVESLLTSSTFSLPQGSAGRLTPGSVINGGSGSKWAGGPGDAVRFYDGTVQLGGGLKKSTMIIRFTFVTDTLGHHHLLVTPLRSAPAGLAWTSS